MAGGEPQILVVFPFKKDKHQDYQEFVDELNKRSTHEGDLCARGNLKDLEFIIINNKLTVIDSMTKRDITSYKTLYIRRWNTRCQDQATAVARYAKAYGLTVMNSENLGLQSFSKLTQVVEMALAGLPQPDTYISSHKNIKRYFKNGAHITFPLVLKSTIGTLGDDNYLVKDYEQLVELLDEHKDTEFMVQQYIPNLSDFRCLILGEKVGLIIERQGKDKENDHRNNTSKGALATLRDQSDFPNEFIQDALTAARVLGREISGVDVLVDSQTGKHYLLEVNKKTMLHEGSFIDEKMDAVTKMFEATLEGNNG